METTTAPLHHRFTARGWIFKTGMWVTAITVALLAAGDAAGQVRTKTPDRGVYQPPLISEATDETSKSDSLDSLAETSEAFGELVRGQQPVWEPTPMAEPALQSHDATSNAGRPLMDVPLELEKLVKRISAKPNPANQSGLRDEKAPARWRETSPRRRTYAIEQTTPVQPQPSRTHRLQQVAHEEVILLRPATPRTTDEPSLGETLDPPTGPEDLKDIQEDAADHGDVAPEVEYESTIEGSAIMHDATCDGCLDCVAASDSMGCDSTGCDSVGHCTTPWYYRWANASLSRDRCRWFGNAELLLMFGRGDRLPPLVTTGPDDDPDTAGELPADPPDGTVILYGNESVLKDMRAGGRLTLGTWLDGRQCRSLVMRGWLAGEDTSRFSTNQDAHPVIARPFFNVTDNQSPAQDTQLVAFPDRADGSIRVRASSEVFGGDVSVRQFWYGRFGGTIDFLYGYQYMRLNEDLRISNSSVSLDDDFAPIDSIIAIDDAFDAENEFHGGQVGIATRYRENCWSFSMLAKVGFGSLRRQAKLAGSTFTSIDGNDATDPNGLLVRSTNSGTFTDDTFGWVPELDMSLGWQRWRCFEATFGYSIIGMTDALRVSGTIDPELAVNLADPPLGQQRPAFVLRDHTYYVQGIHFGLKYVY